MHQVNGARQFLGRISDAHESQFSEPQCSVGPDTQNGQAQLVGTTNFWIGPNPTDQSESILESRSNLTFCMQIMWLALFIEE